MKPAAPKPEVKDWSDFATPFYLTCHPGAEALNRELVRTIFEQEEKGQQYANPYVTSNQVEIFESHFDLFKDPAPCFQELRHFFLFGILYAVRKSNGYSLEDCKKLKVVTDAWYHVTRYGGYISNHTHPNAAWSAVYMVDPGEQPAELPKGGVLSFKDPRVNANMHLDAGNDRWIRHIHMGSVNHEMKPGELMVFPSYVQHEVTPYFGSKPRITIAANCSFTRL